MHAIRHATQGIYRLDHDINQPASQPKTLFKGEGQKRKKSKIPGIQEPSSFEDKKNQIPMPIRTESQVSRQFRNNLSSTGDPTVYKSKATGIDLINHRNPNRRMLARSALPEDVLHESLGELCICNSQSAWDHPAWSRRRQHVFFFQNADRPREAKEKYCTAQLWLLIDAKTRQKHAWQAHYS